MGRTLTENKLMNGISLRFTLYAQFQSAYKTDYETHMFYKHKHSGNKMPNMWVPSYH